MTSYRNNYLRVLKMSGVALAAFAAACAHNGQQTSNLAVDEVVEVAQKDAKIESPVAQTAYGKVRGVVEDGVSVFKGIPYGGDTSERRFKRALPPESWEGVRDALVFADTTPQVESSDTAAFKSWVPDPLPAQSENMLGLNVWTPAADGEKRPVMVWLHGGGFVTGSGSSNVYDGVRLANRGDVVVVSINHRLNAMGYLYLAELGGEEYADSGNVGNLDMIMALEWVRDNIANFGGDPENVLIFGESGGGRKVSTLLAMPEAEGLIDRAIVQSGSHLKVRTPEAATNDTKAYLKLLGVEPDNLEALKDLPTQAFVDALTAPDFTSGRMINFGPVLDGKNILEHPFDGKPAAPSKSVPMLVGSNDDELSLWLIADRAIFTMDYDGIAQRLGAFFPEEDWEAVVAGYREIYPDEKPYELLYTIASDGRYGENAVRQVEAKARQAAQEDGVAPAWLYHFEWNTPIANGLLKSPHALELAFVFDNLAKSESFVGDPVGPQPLADIVADAWIAFARNGDPNTDALPEWPQVTEDNLSAMRLKLEPELDEIFFDAEDKVLDALPSRQ